MKEETILRGLYWFMIAFAFFLLIWWLVGDSPLIDQIALAVIGGFLIHMHLGLQKTNERVAKLEVKFEHMSLDLSSIKQNLAEIKERLR